MQANDQRREALAEYRKATGCSLSYAMTALGSGAMPHTQAQRMLVAHAEGRVMHLGQGLCPDHVEDPDVRDPECPVCRALVTLSQDGQRDE